MTESERHLEINTTCIIDLISACRRCDIRTVRQTAWRCEDQLYITPSAESPQEAPPRLLPFSMATWPSTSLSERRWAKYRKPQKPRYLRCVKMLEAQNAMHCEHSESFCIPKPQSQDPVTIMCVVVKIMVLSLGTPNIRCRIVIGIQKATIILTTTHMIVLGSFFGVGVTKPSYKRALHVRSPAGLGRHRGH